MDMMDLSWLSRLNDLPHVVQSRRDRESGLHKSPTMQEIDAYMCGKAVGLYNTDSNVDEHDCSSWKARLTACKVSSSVVGLSRSTSGHTTLHSSGIVLEIKGVKKILTSAYIVEGRWQDTNTVNVLLPNRTEIEGMVSYVDGQHNIALIHADLEGIDGARFETNLVELGEEVTAISRHTNFKLMASRGEINIRGDHLKSDDLMSSSCTIAEWGIGGPLIDSSGKIIGMNFFSKKCSTPFMPSTILLKCAEHLLDYGRVIRPWIGLRIRSLNEVKVADLELIYHKFQSSSGVIVKEVIKGSPAEEANILVGDVIISCNDNPIRSATQFGEELFKMAETSGSMLRNRKRRARSVEVVIQRVTSGTTMHRSILMKDYTPVTSDSWPVLYNY